MRANSLLCQFILFLSSVIFCSCSKYMLPTPQDKSKLPTSIDSNTGGKNPTYDDPDRDNFLLIIEIQQKLSSIIRTQNIPASKSNPEYGNSTVDKRRSILSNIEAINNELIRLKNQPKPKPGPQPVKSNQVEKLQSEVIKLNSDLEAKNQEILRLNEEIKKLNEQLALNIKPTVITPVIPQPPEVFHSCKVQLKKSKKFVKDIQIKGEVITFNFKVLLKDIKTKHPQNSYSLESNKHSSYLTITNPKLFWANSNELIVWGTKDHHACVDKDVRKK